MGWICHPLLVPFIPWRQHTHNLELFFLTYHTVEECRDALGYDGPPELQRPDLCLHVREGVDRHLVMVVVVPGRGGDTVMAARAPRVRVVRPADGGGRRVRQQGLGILQQVDQLGVQRVEPEGHLVG